MLPLLSINFLVINVLSTASVPDYIFINIWGRIAFGANKQNMSTGIKLCKRLARL